MKLAWVSLFLLIVSIGELQATSNDLYKQSPTADKCTSIAVGKKATKDGSTMCTYNADCAECDWRINKVPAQSWPLNSLRPIYLLSGAYPRQVRNDRGVTWSTNNLEENIQVRAEWEKLTDKEIIGYIPQVEHTYAIMEGLYGIMNEYQVAIGESTCASKLWAAPRGSANGKALLEASELSQIGLERAKTARDAIQVMGDLAVQYGFYSADYDPTKYGESFPMGEGGEALTVIDPNEAWMFHIIPDDTGSSAIWVAQRVPDDHITVVANSFVIRKVDPKSSDFLYSSNLWSIAKKLGWWDERDGLLDFKLVYSPERYHPNYGNRRVWRVLSFAAPSLNLPIETNANGDDYPFSVKVETLLTPEDLMRYSRDHYEGTKYSTTEGLAAGPYGDPNRFDISSNGNMTLIDAMQGEFPRTISLFRTSYSLIAQSRSQVPNELSLFWFAQYAPDQSTYTPIYVASETLPLSWMRGSMHKYDPSSAWWNFCVVGNYASRFYKHAMVPVRALQKKLSDSLLNDVIQLENQLLNLPTITYKETVIQRLTTFTIEKGEYVSSAWRDLFPQLLTQYRDGYIISGLDQPYVTIGKMFYSEYWLRNVGFFDIKGNSNPSAILFASNTALSMSGFINSLLLCIVLSSILFTLIGYQIGKLSTRHQGYALIASDTQTMNFQLYQKDNAAGSLDI